MKNFISLLIILFLTSGTVYANAEYNFYLKRLKRQKNEQIKEINSKIRTLRIEFDVLALDTSAYAPEARVKRIAQCREEIKELKEKKEYIKNKYKNDKTRLKHRFK